MKRVIVFIIVLFIVEIGFGQQRRIALVIGNSNYEHSGRLKNPVNDANLMIETLRDLDFTVISVTDATKDEMNRTIYDFSKKLKDYNVALFYYAGHGIQVGGVNYLLPVDAVLEDKIAAEFEAVDVSTVVSQFERYPDNTNIVILDACRNNPFKSFSRGGETGFKAIPAPSGTIIAFATGEGATASDGTGKNGLYTSMLVNEMKKPQRIEDVFISTRVKVQKASDFGQSPQEWSQLTGRFYFKSTEGSEEDEISGKLATLEAPKETKEEVTLDRGIISQGGYTAKAHISKVLSYGYTVKELIKIGIPGYQMEGINFEGGIIVAIDEESKEGLIAASEDQLGGEGVTWQEAKDVVDFLEIDGYDDWRLPTKKELMLLYKNLKAKDYGDFQDESYWSTSKSGYNNAWGVSFSSGRSYDFDKLSKHSVRAVRTFTLD